MLEDKAVSLDSIVIEVRKVFGGTRLVCLTSLYNEILKTRNMQTIGEVFLNLCIRIKVMYNRAFCCGIKLTMHNNKLANEILNTAKFKKL